MCTVLLPLPGVNLTAVIRYIISYLHWSIRRFTQMNRRLILSYILKVWRKAMTSQCQWIVTSWMWKFLSLLEVVGKVGRCEVDRGIHISWLLHIHNSISCAHQLLTHSLTNQAQFNILLPYTPRSRCQPIPSSFPITKYTHILFVQRILSS
jgi:hypothetical protein